MNYRPQENQHYFSVYSLCFFKVQTPKNQESSSSQRIEVDYD